jgi:Ca-activated chloride channel family protein
MPENQRAPCGGIYAVYLKPNAQGRLATVQLRWLDPKTRQPAEINGNLNTWELGQDYYAMQPHYQLAVLAAQYADILKGTPWAQEMDMWQVYNLANGLRERLPHDQDLSEFVDLVSRAAQLKQGNRNY